MTIPPRHPKIAHLGLNFWRLLATKKPSYSNGSGDSLLLCIDDAGIMVVDFLLDQPSEAGGWLPMHARVCLAKSSGASTVVRVQKRSADYSDPFQINSRSTQALYGATHLYNLQLVEVILPWCI